METQGRQTSRELEVVLRTSLSSGQAAFCSSQKSKVVESYRLRLEI